MIREVKCAVQDFLPNALQRCHALFGSLAIGVTEEIPMTAPIRQAAFYACRPC
jgi:hypothetical protein